MKLRIGTRGSRLALAQSEYIKKRIMQEHPDIRIELVKIKTKGDRILNSPLSMIGGKGLFVKEIEEALLNKDVDLAVHSIKDVPAELPEGLFMPIFPKREDPRDALLSMEYNSLDELPENGNIGTGSLRRSAQLLSQRPDLNVVSLRGNVDTRIKKLETDHLQGIILAVAGLNRLGLSSRIKQILEPKDFLPAVGQGAIGVELRVGDDITIDLLNFLNDKSTESGVRAERSFLKELGGGCQVPIAGYCLPRGDKDEGLILEGMVAGLDGRTIMRDREAGTKDNPEDIGVRLARRLLDSGAKKILSGIYGEEKR